MVTSGGDEKKQPVYFKMPGSSGFYNVMANTLYGERENLQLIWERDLNSNTGEDKWKIIVANIGCSVRDAVGKYTQYTTN